jgi:ubiquinone/menaquinone biosynthesis C-methylase UbiE
MTISPASAHEKRIIDQFSRQAGPLAAARGAEHDEAIRRLLAAANVTPLDVVLDVACGTGQVAVAFARVAKHVTGIDLTPAMIYRAQALQAAARLDNVRWLVGTVDQLPFAAASFSVVNCRYAFHHMVDPPKAVAEMSRVCLPGGRVLLVDVITTSERAEAYDRWERLRDPSHVQALTVNKLVGLAKDNGLSHVRCDIYKFDIELDLLLSGSFPAPGDDAQVRQLAVQDVGHDRLGVGARWQGSELIVSYPIAIVVGEKPERTA